MIFNNNKWLELFNDKFIIFNVEIFVEHYKLICKIYTYLIAT